ncbi:MAG: hypothetical protein K2I25_03240, partial [Muribaculaceae bacterium]|nr:hypothetical protein [Muribaculaceae bacterium]
HLVLHAYYRRQRQLCIRARTSCSDDEKYDDWHPGEADDNPGVYFTADNIKLNSITKGSDPVVTLNLGRISRNGEATVPIEYVAGDPRITVPQNVTFADGSEFASIDIDCSALPEKEIFDITLKIDDRYVNTYSNGYAEYYGQVIISDWDKVNSGNPVTFKILEYDYSPSEWATFTGDMYNLDGTQQYRIDNFMNSGENFTFEITASAYPGYEGYGRIVPLSNQTMWEEVGWTSYGDHEWFFTGADGSYPEFSLTSAYDGSDYPLWGVNFCWYNDDYQSEYCYARIKEWNDASGQKGTINFVYMNFYAFYDEDFNNYTNYLYLYFDWE